VKEGLEKDGGTERQKTKALVVLGVPGKRRATGCGKTNSIKIGQVEARSEKRGTIAETE